MIELLSNTSNASDLVICFQYFIVLFSMLLEIESTKSVKDTPQPQYRQYTYRFLIAFLTAALSFIVGAQWVTVGPIETTIERVYGQHEITITFLSIIFYLIFLPLNFPVNWIVDVKGPRLSICIGAVLIFVGSGIRCMVQFSFILLIVGQVICAAGEVFLVNPITKIVVNWFAPRRHSLAIIILANMIYVGASIGYEFPDAFVDINAPPQTVQYQFRSLLLFQFALTVIPGILTLAMFKNQPPTPACKLPPVDHTSYKEEILGLLKNKGFLYVNLAMGLYCGTFYAFPALLGDLLSCYGYSQNQVSILGFIMLAVGFVLAICVALYVERSHNFVWTFRFLAIFGFIQCAGFPLILYFFGYNFPLMIVLTVIQAAAFLPVCPLTLDYSINVFYPKGEALITGCLFTSSGLFGTLFSLAVPAIFGLAKKGNTQEENQHASLWTTITFGVTAGLGALMYCFFNHRLLRTEKENMARRESLLQLTSGNDPRSQLTPVHEVEESDSK